MEGRTRRGEAWRVCNLSSWVATCILLYGSLPDFPRSFALSRLEPANEGRAHAVIQQGCHAGSGAWVHGGGRVDGRCNHRSLPCAPP